MATLTKNYQKIATGGSQSFGYATGYLELWAKYNSQDIANNKTNYSVQLRLVVSGGYIGNYQATNYSLSGTGLTTNSGNLGSGDYTSRTIATITGNVTHDSEGKKNISSNGSINFTAWGQTLSVSCSATLPTIPRQANITTAQDFNDEENPTISYSNPAGSVVSSLQACISFDGTNDTISYRDIDKLGTSYTFELTEEERNILRAGTTESSRKVQFLIKTVLGSNTFYSSKEVNFNIINANPIFNDFDWQTTNYSNLTGNNKIVIKDYSTIRTIISSANQAIPQKQATMKSYQTTVGSKSKTETNLTYPVQYDVENVDGASISVFAIDSRNNSTPITKPIQNYIQYKPLEKTPLQARRTQEVNSEVNLKFEGKIDLVNFGVVTNSIKSCKYYYKEAGSSGDFVEGQTTLTPTLTQIEGTIYRIEIDQNIAGDLGASGFDINNSYLIQIVINDELSSVEDVGTLGNGSPAIAMYKNCVSLGGPYDERLGGRVQINGSIAGNGNLKYKGHVNSIDDLPLDGQSSGNPIDPMLSNFSTCLNASVSSDSDRVFSNYGKAHGDYYVVLGAFGSSWPSRYRPMVVYTDYKEQLKLSIIKYGSYYYACILAEYDASKPVYYAYNGTSANNAVTSDLEQNTHRVTTNMVLCSIVNSTYREFSGWPSYPSLERTNITDLKFDTEYHSDYTQVFTNVSYYTEANIVKSVYDNSQGSFYWNDGMILIQPDTDDRPKIITNINNASGEENDMYTVGNNNDIYHYNSNQEWQQWAQSSGGGSDTYSTEERVIGTWIDGKPLYRKVYNFGNLPNAAIGYIQSGFKSGEIFVTRASGVTNDGTTQYFLPYVHPVTIAKCVSLYSETLSGNIVITIRTGENRSSHTAHIILEYTKTSD